jgi:hypothetical protein
MKDYLARDFVPIESNVFRRADGTTHKVWIVPTQCENGYVIMGAVGGNIYVLFGYDSGVVADPTAYSADAGGNVLTVDADSPDRITENTVTRMWIPRGVRVLPATGGGTTDSQKILYFGIVGDTENAEWFMYPISEDHVR